MSKETIEEAADRWVFETNGHKWSNNNNEAGDNFGSFEAGAAWQEQRMYSDFDVMDALHSVELKDNKNYTKIYNGMKEWFDQNKKQKS